MTGWILWAASLGAAIFAWRGSPAAVSCTSASRRRARWLAAACGLCSAAAGSYALGHVPGLCAACATLAASCSVMPFAVEAVRRMRLHLRATGGRACRTAS
jgi:hypothetical protein